MKGVHTPAIGRNHRGRKDLHDIVKTRQTEISTVRIIPETRVVIGQDIAKGNHQVEEDGVTDAIVQRIQVNTATCTGTPRMAQLARRVG